jgi:hypothetical protein
MSNTIHEQNHEFAGTTRGTARVRLTHVDLTAAALAQTFTFADLLKRAGDRGQPMPAWARVRDAVLVRAVDFAGGGAASATIDVGDAADPDELIAAASIFTGAKAGAAIAVANGAYVLGSFEAAYAPQLTITSDVNVDTLTEGALEVRIIYDAYSPDTRI